MWLLIDDTRNLNCDAIARNAEAAKKLLTLNCWECVCFDHDLGLSASGYDVMQWMFQNEIYPENIQLVTSNPVGRDNMAAILKHENYTSTNGYIFKRGERE
jgi:hypothetical protein